MLRIDGKLDNQRREILTIPVIDGCCLQLPCRSPDRPGQRFLLPGQCVPSTAGSSADSMMAVLPSAL